MLYFLSGSVDINIKENQEEAAFRNTGTIIYSAVSSFFLCGLCVFARDKIAPAGIFYFR